MCSLLMHLLQVCSLLVLYLLRVWLLDLLQVWLLHLLLESLMLLLLVLLLLLLLPVQQDTASGREAGDLLRLVLSPCG
jgi:glucan phosphoethanolaminetransferase (alkaline phosphatase superfamily)